MSLDMRVEPGRDYLTIFVSGTFALQLANALTPRILDACAEHRASRLLLDVRAVKGTLWVAERFIYSETFARLYMERRAAGKLDHVQIACVGTSPVIDPQRFGEKVARARGLPLKVSTDIEEALAWLGVNPPASA